MRFTNFARVASAAVALTVSASVASAQSWQALGPVNGSGGNFWNNQSYDTPTGGTPCNIGAVLTGVATNAGCVNETPANLLPQNTGITQYLGNAGAATGFMFGAGYWEISLLGNITGATPPRAYTIRDNNGGGSLGTITTVGNKLIVNSASGIYFDISAWSPSGTIFNSKTLTSGRSQFGAFAVNGASLTTVGGVSAIANTGDGRKYFVGMEDNACVGTFGILVQGCNNADGGANSPASDYDYNDIILQVTAVPEPSSVALMGFGLVGLVVAARRRRNA